MPTYAFQCDQCSRKFDALCSWAESQNYKCEVCGQAASKLLTTCSIKFSDPKSTSKWDNFSYRAGYNLEKAQGERRAAEAREKDSSPYTNIDDSYLPGVFGKGGIDAPR